MDPTSSLNRIEFDVNLSCNNCASTVTKALQSLPDVKLVEVNVERQSVVVETVQPSQAIKEAIEKTGKRAVLKGFGTSNLGSAVAELKNKDGVLGVIRFHQNTENVCFIDGTIDGLTAGEHGLQIHELGDLSSGSESIGSVFNPINFSQGGPSDKERHYGDLGSITADHSGRASFVLEDNVVKVWDIIGRSIAVTAEKDDLGHGRNETSKVDGKSGNILACAIIARSSGLFQNPKRICQCDGISIWDERNVPASSL